MPFGVMMDLSLEVAGGTGNTAYVPGQPQEACGEVMVKTEQSAEHPHCR